MDLKYKNLSGVSFEKIHQLFLNAFADYAVDVSYMTPDILNKRAIKNAYKPELSVGVYDSDCLVGFTLVGMDNHFGYLSAFDIMTGLVKEYRGKGIASRMFDFIKPELKAEEVESFYLEVLQENKPAIKAYQKTGFTITRSFDCYQLELSKLNMTEIVRVPIKFYELDRNSIHKFESISDWVPSWENSFNSINRIPDDLVILEAEYSINKVGLIVYYPTLNWIMALLVDPKYRHMGVGSALLNELKNLLNGHADMIKFLNIQSDDDDLTTFLKQSGFEYLIGQYEMKYKL